MSTNMTLITSVTVGSGGAASVTLPATGTIPQTYTDLKIVISARTNRSSAVDAIGVYYNGDTTSARYTAKQLTGTGSGTQSTSYNPYNDENMYVSGASATASTFGNSEIYIPNYTGSNQKSASTDSVGENNATLAYSNMGASLYNQTTAITTISFIPITGTTILEGSTFYLYGISNVTSTTKATGGIVSSDGTYNYHMFPYSGTFTPTQAISADVLVIAGGGGGGTYGGGGAGGLRTFTSQSLTTTAYTCTIGSGGNAANGSNSSFAGSGFSTINATGGGRGGVSAAGSSGGSGGGGGAAGGTSGGSSYSGGAGNAGSYTPVEGYAGGNNWNQSGAAPGGGGGGAGGVGGNATGTWSVTATAGSGGIGATSSLINAMAIATQTGQNSGSNYYYAGGGGGGTEAYIAGTGGIGGGGNGGSNAAGQNGMANTGGGGGAYGGTGSNGQGGSGLVIIRYAI